MKPFLKFQGYVKSHGPMWLPGKSFNKFVFSTISDDRENCSILL